MIAATITSTAATVIIVLVGIVDPLSTASRRRHRQRRAQWTQPQLATRHQQPGSRRELQARRCVGVSWGYLPFFALPGGFLWWPFALPGGFALPGRSGWDWSCAVGG